MAGLARSQDCGAPMKVCTGAKTDSSKMSATAFPPLTSRRRSSRASRKPAVAVNNPAERRQGEVQPVAPAAAGKRLVSHARAFLHWVGTAQGEPAMASRKAELLQRIESDRDMLIDFLRGFIRCPSPNPPGDTRAAADGIAGRIQRLGRGLAGQSAGNGRKRSKNQCPSLRKT